MELDDGPIVEEGLLPPVLMPGDGWAVLLHVPDKPDCAKHGGAKHGKSTSVTESNKKGGFKKGTPNLFVLFH
jgi:hypothetical protein